MLYEIVNGKKVSLRKGKYHSFGGLPAVVSDRGDKEWWADGVRHRVGGPLYALPFPPSMCHSQVR